MAGIRPRGRGICRFCEKEHPLRLDGMVRKHYVVHEGKKVGCTEDYPLRTLEGGEESGRCLKRLSSGHVCQRRLLRGACTTHGEKTW